MKKLFPGLNSAVIIRRPATRRTAKRGPIELVPDWDPPSAPTVLQAIYVTKSGDGRVARFVGPWSSAQIFSLADRLAYGTFYPGIRGGWLLNEQVVGYLYDVVPL